MNIKYHQWGTGDEYGANFELTDNWNPNADYGKEYVNVYCDCSDCELFGRCDNCVFPSECDMNETCFTNNIPIKEKEDIFEEYEEENDLPF